MVLRSRRHRQLRIPRVTLHIKLTTLIVLVNKGLLLALLLQLLVRLLTASHHGCCVCIGLIVVVAQVDFHAWLLRSLCFVHVLRSRENIDMLIQTRIIIEMLIEASIPALATLVRLLGVVSRLVQVVLVDEAGAGVDDLAS